MESNSVRSKPSDLVVQANRNARKLQRSRRIDTTKHDHRVMLKIKLKSLAAEARIIRREETARKGGDLRGELRAHRVFNLRIEARLTGLAYGFIRGRTYESMEPTTSSAASIDWDKVRVMLKKYGPPNTNYDDLMPESARLVAKKAA